MGSVPVKASRGNWEGDTLTFFSDAPGQRSRYTFRFESPTQYSFKIEGSRDGTSWMPYIEASYSKIDRG